MKTRDFYKLIRPMGWIKWIGSLLTLALVILGVATLVQTEHSAMERRASESLDQHIDTLERHLDQHIDTLERHLDQRIDTLERNTNQRFDTLERHLDQRFDTLELYLNPSE